MNEEQINQKDTIIGMKQKCISIDESLIQSSDPERIYRLKVYTYIGVDRYTML